MGLEELGLLEKGGRFLSGTMLTLRIKIRKRLKEVVHDLCGLNR